MSRRSPRFLCPLLWLGYDEIEGGLVPYFSADEALALMQTCRSMFILVLRAFNGARLNQMRRLHVTFEHALISSEFLQLPKCRGHSQYLLDILTTTITNVEALHNHIVCEAYVAYCQYVHSRRGKDWNYVLRTLRGFSKASLSSHNFFQDIEQTMRRLKEVERNFLADRRKQ